MYEKIMDNHMNKQQLAARIWAMANDMRSKIAANEYKDFILGFMFYKFLSDKELQLLKKSEFTEEEIQNLTEDNKEVVDFVKGEIGFFIAYKNLFSTRTKKSDFDISDVTTALSDFNFHIHEDHKKVYEKIFNTLETGLIKLGDNTKSQTTAVKKIINLIKTIPMGSNDYDVLGFIYEYLISNFAANAGKKAGEFYTPHEVSILMSEIIANHLKDSDEIKIYDPTSGSGSLLINIGKSVAKHVKDPKSIVYYAQELKSETYNLTRMNLIMRGISSHNIHARNADTLEEDWPPQDEEGNSDPLYLDAVVSNPPYSQKRNPSDKGDDPRYVEYGVAPQGKADYAFLLHDLYHIKPDGIMTIVLPHGVLFRGGEEYEIRKNLVDKNKIDTIIGLPANIFFGTSIPTIVMVLKKHKQDDNIQIIDASKYCIKDGKNNKLKTSDIKRIVDVILSRTNKDKFSKIITKQEIIDNDYNLNISRYVDSSEQSEKWDIYATMFGGIPENELSEYDHYFELFPGLKDLLFSKINEKYFEKKSNDINNDITNYDKVNQYKSDFQNIFSPFYNILKGELIDNYKTINVVSAEKELGDQLFDLLNPIKLIDNYDAYQVLSDNWNSISGNIEILKSEGLEACRKIDQKYKWKKDDDSKELIEVPDGYKGRIIEFEIVKKYKLQDEVKEIKDKNTKLSDINNNLSDYFLKLTEEENLALGDATNDDGFVKSEIGKLAKNIINKDAIIVEEKIDKIFKSLSDQELQNLCNAKNTGFKIGEVNKLAKQFIKTGIQYDDNSFESKMINVYLLNEELKTIKEQIKNNPKDPKNEYDEESLEYKIILINDFLISKSAIESDIKALEDALLLKIMDTIEHLTDEEIIDLLEHQRIDPIMNGVYDLFDANLKDFSKGLENLSKKYDLTLSDLENEIQKNGKELGDMVDELVGDDFDIKGLKEFKSLLNN